MNDEDIVNDLFEASGAFFDGDESGVRRLLPYILKKEVTDGIPVLFYVVDNVELLEFLAVNGVDFYQRTELGGESLLHQVSLGDESDVFEWVLGWYKDKNIIDTTDDAGITTLSSLVKFGNAPRATRLVDSGADLKSVAENGLTPARQAVLCIEGEEDALECLSMLFSKGLVLNVDELTFLAQTARGMNRLNLENYIEKIIDFRDL